MLTKIYSGKNHDANFDGKGCLKCLLSLIMLVNTRG